MVVHCRLFIRYLDIYINCKYILVIYKYEMHFYIIVNECENMKYPNANFRYYTIIILSSPSLLTSLG